MPDFVANLLCLPENVGYLVTLRSAKAWGRDPVDKLLPGFEGSTLLRARLRNKLEDALQIVEDETCQECGQPIWLCNSTLNQVQFKIKRLHCYAANDLRKAREVTSKSKHLVGQDPYVVLDLQGPMPTRAEGLASIDRGEEE